MWLCLPPQNFPETLDYLISADEESRQSFTTFVEVSRAYQQCVMGGWLDV